MRQRAPTVPASFFVTALILGSAVDASAQGTWMTRTGTLPGEFAGAAVAGVGDLDGDGFADVALGCPGRPADGAAGRVVVFSGKDGAVLHDLVGNAGDRLGTSIDGIGDVDGDGVPDFAIGANQNKGEFTYFGHQPGMMRVVSGQTGLDLAQFFGNTQAESFGQCVRCAGDVDLDGVPDVIVGAPGAAGAGGEGVGRVAVISGASGVTLHSFEGVGANDWLGRAVDGEIDFDQDGRPDLVAGAYGASYESAGGAGYDAGHVYLYSGLDGSVLRDLTGWNGPGWFGWSVAAVPDMDHDGVGEVIVGSYIETKSFGNTLEGAVRVFSGATGALRFLRQGDLPFDLFGTSVTGIGDVDGDGAEDFSVGASEFCVPGGGPLPDGRGYVRTFSGETGDVIHTIRSDELGSGFGESVDGAGDVNGDGVPDVLIGSPAGDVGAVADAGAVRVVSADDRFDVGDTVRGEIAGDDDLASGTFDGLDGMKVTIEVTVESGDLAPTVRVIEPDGDVVDAWTLKSTAGSLKKSTKLKTRGVHRIEVVGADGSTGSFRIATARKLPTDALSHPANAKASNAGIASFDVQALAGTTLDATFIAKKGLSSGGDVELLFEDLAGPDTAGHVTVDGKKLFLSDLVLPDAGWYRIRVHGPKGKSKVKAQIELVPPPAGEGEVVLP